MSKALHLNLLRDSERVSSSPIRIRVMLPVLAMLACAGILVWWGILTGRVLVLNSKISTLEDDLQRRQAEHANVLNQMNRANELELEIEQLGYYRTSRQCWGPTLSSLAEVMPLKVQLVKLEIPPPPVQDLSRPKGVKGPPLWGPTNITEDVRLVLSGRTPKQTPVISLMESLESEAFTNTLVIVKDPRSPNPSPRVRSFRQDVPQRGEGERMLTFEIEYRARERRFAP